MSGRLGPALVLLAHGSRDPRHADAARALVRRIGERRRGLRTAVGFLDFDRPTVPALLHRLSAEGVGEAVCVPLLLTPAHHARTDVPAALEPPPGLLVRGTRVLGPDPLLLEAMELRLAEAGLTPEQRGRTGVVLAVAGTSLPPGRAVVAALADRWRWRGWHSVGTAHASGDGPGTGDAVAALRRRGATRVAVAPCLIAPGRLADRIAAEAHRAGADLVGGCLGDAPQLVELVLRRYTEACRPRVGSVSGPHQPPLRQFPPARIPPVWTTAPREEPAR